MEVKPDIRELDKKEKNCDPRSVIGVKGTTKEGSPPSFLRLIRNGHKVSTTKLEEVNGMRVKVRWVTGYVSKKRQYDRVEVEGQAINNQVRDDK